MSRRGQARTMRGQAPKVNLKLFHESRQSRRSLQEQRNPTVEVFSVRRYRSMTKSKISVHMAMPKVEQQCCLIPRSHIRIPSCSSQLPCSKLPCSKPRLCPIQVQVVQMSLTSMSRTSWWKPSNQSGSTKADLANR